MAEELSLGDRKAVQTILEQRHEEASFMGVVEKKDDGKSEKRIFVVGTYRLFTMNKGKIEREAHYLDIVEIKSSKAKEVQLTFSSAPATLTIGSDAADDIIHCIRTAYAASFPGLPEKSRYRLDVQPESRLKDLVEPELPLGGFVATYKSLCARYNTEAREDVVWDMENLFGHANITEFNLNEFDVLAYTDLKPILGALQHSTYFKTLTAKEYPLEKNVVTSLAETLKFNLKLEEISLKDVGLSPVGIGQISESLTFNKTLSLTSIDISLNPLEEKGISAFASYLSSLNRGLAKLDISGCNINAKGMTAFTKALKTNVHMTSTLTYLDISGNKLEADGSAGLAAFLANPNSMRSLNIGNTVANLDPIMGAISRGTSSELSKLDISQNKLAKKDSLVKYLQAAALLKELNLTDTALTPEVAKDIIHAMNSNPYLKDCVVNLSDNKLGVSGARQIGSVADKIINIISLDLSDNDFGDEGIHHLAEAFCYSTHLKHISFDRNYKKGKEKKSSAVDGLITLIKSECPIESLSVAGGPKSEFKSDLFPLLFALANNDKIKSLDVSGNQLGNKGAMILGKLLQTNDKLEVLKWDNNGTTYQGFDLFNIGLNRNHTLKSMPLPVQDIAAALKESSLSKALMDVVTRMERNIIRNQSPEAKYQSLKTEFTGSGNQFAFLTSGQREQVQKLLLKIKSTGRKVTDENQIAIEDADNQDHYMTNLFSLKDEFNVQMEDDLKNRLISNAKSILPVYQVLKAKLVEKVMAHVKTSYHCLEDDIVKRLKTVLEFGGKDLEEEDIERILVEAAGTQLNVKASQAFHSLITIASDYIYEKVQDQLVDINDELVHEINEEGLRKEEEARNRELKQAGKPEKTDKPKEPKEGKEAKPPKTEPKEPKESKPPKTAPAPPPAKAKPPVNRASKPTGTKKDDDGKPAPEVHVEQLEKVQGNLEHLTKARPAQQGKRPPTRKPRAQGAAPQ